MRIGVEIWIKVFLDRWYVVCSITGRRRMKTRKFSSGHKDQTTRSSLVHHPNNPMEAIMFTKKKMLIAGLLATMFALPVAAQASPRNHRSWKHTKHRSVHVSQKRHVHNKFRNARHYNNLVSIQYNKIMRKMKRSIHLTAWQRAKRNSKRILLRHRGRIMSRVVFQRNYRMLYNKLLRQARPRALRKAKRQARRMMR